MEKMVTVQKINEQGKMITKDVDERLLALYVNLGWKQPIIKKNTKYENIQKKKIDE